MDRKYLLRIAGYIALALAALILIIDIAFQLAGSLVASVETLPVTSVKEAQTLNADAYVVRTEVPLEYTSDGLLAYTVSDGTRVAAGDKVAEVYSGDAGQSEQLSRLYAALSRRELLETAIAQKGSYSVSAVEREITRLKSEIDSLTAQGNTVGLSALTDSLQIMLYIRELKSGNDLSAVQTAMDEEIVALKEKVGGALAAVQSDRTGYYYSACDGYENYITVDKLMSADPAELRSLFSGETVPQEMNGTAGKIVTDYTWGIVMEVPFTSSQQLSEGRVYPVLLPELGDRSVQMKLDRLLVEYGADTSLLVFTCTEMPSGFSYTRFQSVSIVLSETDGFRLPVSALRQLNGVTGVYILRGSVVEFREISPIVLSEGAVLVDSSAEPTGDFPMLAYYDTVIVRGKELYVGKIIDQ